MLQKSAGVSTPLAHEGFGTHTHTRVKGLSKQSHLPTCKGEKVLVGKEGRSGVHPKEEEPSGSHRGAWAGVRDSANKWFESNAGEERSPAPWTPLPACFLRRLPRACCLTEASQATVSAPLSQGPLQKGPKAARFWGSTWESGGGSGA